MKLSVAVDIYIQRRQDAGEKFDSGKMRLHSFRRFCGDIALCRITAQQVSAFLNSSRMLPNTRSMKLGTLNGFFEY